MHLLVSCFFLLFAPQVPSNQFQPPGIEKWSQNSPNGFYLAVTRIVPDPEFIGRTDLDTTRLIVRRHANKLENETYVRYDLGRIISQIQWSPDSKYIVMSTVSAGGHSPWHFTSYVYSVDDQSLREMDDIIGEVLDPRFEFVGPHTVKMKIPGPGFDIDSPVSVKVDLMKKAPLMKEQEGKKDGKGLD